jgi:hypothetical protein
MSDRGTFICYKSRDFKPDSLKLIEISNRIIAEYEGAGLSLTLRQLYYQLVARTVIENNQGSYNRLGDLISNARLAGLVSWTALEDRGRQLMGHRTFDSPAEAVHALADLDYDDPWSYRIDMWANQPWRPEVWVEKQAMEGVLAGICYDLRVDFYATKGYNSQSEQWRAGQRFSRYIRKGQRPIVFHLADHDPSGFDMTEDLKSRLEMFCGVPILVQRLGLNSEQIHKYSPPPNVGKTTDGRLAKYMVERGTDQVWELDALSPSVIQGLIRDAVGSLRDPALWAELMEQETADKRVLHQTAEELTMMQGGK